MVFLYFEYLEVDLDLPRSKSICKKLRGLLDGTKLLFKWIDLALRFLLYCSFLSAYTSKLSLMPFQKKKNLKKP